MQTILTHWAAVVVGFALGLFMAAWLRANRSRIGDPGVILSVESVEAAKAIRHDLYEAGAMLETGEFEYVSGSFAAYRIDEEGLVSIGGDLLLRSVEK